MRVDCYIACMIHASDVLVIAGSVRPKRLCIQIAQWAAGLGSQATGESFEVVDLKDWPLPADDEPAIPAAGEGYAHAHTLAWSRKVAAARAFVLVAPQYNWGYPAPLKNALDHLYGEWAGKPVMIVTYGGHGGDKCSRQLMQVCKGLHMKPIRIRPKMRLPRTVIEANPGEIDPAVVFAAHAGAIRRGFGKLVAMCVKNI